MIPFPVLKSISSNWALSALQILVFMALTRFTLNALGRETFGIWESIVAAAGPLQLFVLGVPMATVRRMSEEFGRGDRAAAHRALGQSVSLTLMLALLALGLGAVLLLGMDKTLLSESHWDLSSEQVIDARTALLVAVLNVAAGFFLRLPYTVLEAHQDFVTKNLVLAAGMLLRLLLTVAALSFRNTLLVLALVQPVIAVIEFLLALLVLARRHQGLSLCPARPDLTEVRRLLGFSLFAFLLNMGALFAFQLDAIVIGAFKSPEAVATYGMANKIFDPMISLLLAIGMVVMPRAATLAVRGERNELAALLEHWSKVAAYLVTTLAGYLLFLGPSFLAWWLEEEYDPAAGPLLQVLMASFLFFLPIRGVALPILLGASSPKAPGLLLLAMGLLNLLLSLLLVGPYGVMGVALGTAIPNVLFAATIVPLASRSLHSSPARWLSHALPKVLLGWLPGLLFLSCLRIFFEVEGFWPLFLAGLAYLLIQLGSGLMVTWRRDPFFDPWALLQARRGRA